MRIKFAAAAPLLIACLSSSWISAQTPDKTLNATPTTVVWGYYSAHATPVLTVHSGDTVKIQTLSTCGSNERLEKEGVAASDIPSYNADIYREVKDKGPGGHILTGPVEIAEAEPGDVLEIQIQKIDIDVPWACNGFGAGRGFLPNDYPYGHSKIIPLDREKMIAKFAPGIEIPLHPFFGSMGNAPPPSASPARERRWRSPISTARPGLRRNAKSGPAEGRRDSWRWIWAASRMPRGLSNSRSMRLGESIFW